MIGKKKIKCDVCILGGSSEGINIAIAANSFGRKTIIFEPRKLDDDFVDYSCIPSKTLIEIANKINIVKSGTIGISGNNQKINFTDIMNYIKSSIKEIKTKYSVDKLASLGIKVIQNKGQITKENLIIGGNYQVLAQRIVIACGSVPKIPKIYGLNKVKYYTNKTIFQLTDLPEHLVIIGGEYISCELAQAFKRLGSQVTIIESKSIIKGADEDAISIITKQFTTEGIKILNNHKVIATNQDPSGAYLNIVYGKSNNPSSIQHQNTIKASHILISTGNENQLNDLKLEKANIKYTNKGITVNKSMQSISNKKVYAVGNSAGIQKFNSANDYQSNIIIKKMLLGIPQKYKESIVPKVVYTDPEIAWIGLTEQEAREKYINIMIKTASFAKNDRAITQINTAGKIKLIFCDSKYLVGVGIIGKQASELICIWQLVMAKKIKYTSLANLICSSPSRSKISNEISMQNHAFYSKSPIIRRLLEFVRHVY